MLVTAYTDASYHQSCDSPYNRQAGWGIWLRAHNLRVTAQGRCPAHIIDNNCAELYACLMSVKLAVDTIPAMTKILINTDAQAIMRAPNSERVTQSYIMQQNMHREIMCIALGNRLEIEWRHVKAHTGGEDTRSWINRAVDRMAKRGRRMPLTGISEVVRITKLGGKKDEKENL